MALDGHLGYHCGGMPRNRRFWLGVAVSALFLYLALRGQRFDEIWAALRSANYLWVIPATAVFFVALVLKAYRWHLLVRPVKEVPTSRMFPVMIIGYTGNNIFPLRAGELLRAYLLRQREGISVSASLGTVVAERTLDGITLLIFLLAILPVAPQAGIPLALLIPAVAVFAGAGAALFLAATFPDRARSVVARIAQMPLPRPAGERVSGLAEQFLDGLLALRGAPNALGLLAVSILVWVVESGKFWVLMQGLPFDRPYYVMLFATSVVNLATVLPAMPGYVGTFEAAGRWSLELFAVPSQLAFSFILLAHAILWFPVTALGLVLMTREGLRWREVGQLGAWAGQEVGAPLPPSDSL